MIDESMMSMNWTVHSSSSGTAAAGGQRGIVLVGHWASLQDWTN